MTEPRITLVAAVARNRVIGADGGLPWHIPSDLKRFRAVTMGRPVMMGRRTFESIGKPLDGRTNIVVTGRADFSRDGVVVAHSIEAAMRAAREDAKRRETAEIAVIGGATIYEQTIGDADRLAVTEVHAAPDGDAFFPPIDAETWREVEREPIARTDRDSHSATFVLYERR